MIILYTSPGCASCRKAKQWLKDNDLKFVEKNIFTTLLKEDEIKYLLSRTENGTEDIISTRSKVFQEMDVNLDDMGLNELVQFIRENPARRAYRQKSRQVGGEDAPVDRRFCRHLAVHL